MTSLYSPRNRCRCVRAEERFHLVVDCLVQVYWLREHVVDPLVDIDTEVD